MPVKKAFCKFLFLGTILYLMGGICAPIDAQNFIFKLGNTDNSDNTIPFTKSIAAAPEDQPIRRRVVLIVLDGVRTEEIFIGAYPYLKRRNYRHSQKSLLPFIWKTLIPSNTLQFGNIYNRKSKNKCLIDNPSGRSLPAYASLFSGRNQKNVTKNNFKKTILYPGIIDELTRFEKFQGSDFAIFASWQPIENIIRQNKVLMPVIDTGYKKTNPKPPWHDARYDYHTYQAVMSFLNTNQSFRFLFVGFNDSDEWGHYGNYPRYLKSLKYQDHYIKKIYNNLLQNNTPVYDTIFIITTDHGRGRGRFWKQHSARLNGPKNIWALVHSTYRNSDQLEKLISNSGDLNTKCSHNQLAELIRSYLEH